MKAEATALESPVEATRSTKAPRMWMSEGLFRNLTLASAVLVVAFLGGIFMLLLVEAWPALSKFGISFLYTSSWNPVTDMFGALPPIYGTLVTSAIAMILGVPLAFGVVFFL